MAPAILAQAWSLVTFENAPTIFSPVFAFAMAPKATHPLPSEPPKAVAANASAVEILRDAMEDAKAALEGKEVPTKEAETAFVTPRDVEIEDLVPEGSFQFVSRLGQATGRH